MPIIEHFHDVLEAAASIRSLGRRRRHEQPRTFAFSAEFWAKVKVGTEDECWPWTGYVMGQGYGRLTALGFETTAAHRVAYELAYGVAPGQSNVCHSCDNPPCCNPHHLWLGTQSENVLDGVKKGRVKAPVLPAGKAARGESVSRAKLTSAQVLEIARSDVPTGEMARQLGVTCHAIWCIRSGKTWSHLTGLGPDTQVDLPKSHWRKVVVGGVEYENMALAAKAVGTSINTIKNRAENSNFSDYGYA